MNYKHYILMLATLLSLSTVVACGGGTTNSDEEEQNDEESDNPTDTGGSEDEATGSAETESDAEVEIDSDVVGAVSLSTLKIIGIEGMDVVTDTVMASFAATADGEATTEAVRAFFSPTGEGEAESFCTVLTTEETEDAVVVEDSTELSAGLLSVTGDAAFIIAPQLDGLASTYYGTSITDPNVSLRTAADYTLIFSGADNRGVDEQFVADIVIPEFTIEAMSVQGDDNLLVGKTPVESFIDSGESIEINNLKTLNWQAMEGMATASASATQYGKQLLTIFTATEDETESKLIYCYINPDEGNLNAALANSSSNTLIEDTLNELANGVVSLQISLHQVHAKLDEVNLSLPENGTALVYTTAGGTVNYIVTAE